MIEIKKKGKQRHISITRGDYAVLTTEPRDKQGNRIPCDGTDVVIKIQVREPPGNGSTLLFEGDVTYTEDGVGVWVIHPNDTRNAPKREYVYDVQVQMADDIVLTYIPLSDFILLPESTEKGV